MAAMKTQQAARERPMLFSGPMVRAILDGRKTQTRRIIKPQPDPDSAIDVGVFCPSIVLRDGTLEAGEKVFGVHSRDGDYGAKCPWRVGDKLWVRETWQTKQTQHCVCPQPSEPSPCDAYMKGIGCQFGERQVAYAASGDNAPCWRPSIHMPRWAARIFLEVTGVRAERVREISEEDAKAEGVEPYRCPQADALMNAVGGGMKPIPYTSGFANLWNSIAKPGETWDANPWVWVIEFKRKVTR